jgi:peptidoglycan/xylan/chitin deacetylase (PgdA/CDA1 family)
MNSYRLLLVSDQPPKSLWNLASRIERELPSARICGIALQTPPREIRRSEVRRHSLVDFLLTVVHGSAASSSSAVFQGPELAHECRRRHWPLLISDDLANQESACFVRGQSADLALVAGTPNVDPAILRIPRFGSLRVQISHSSGDRNAAKPAAETSSGSEKRLSVSVEPAFDAQPAQRVISVQLPVQPFDSPAATSLVRDLITSDLLILAVSSLCRGKTSDIHEQVSSWVREMLAPCFSGDAPQSLPDWQEPSRWRTRPAWKLFLHSLVLFSPCIIARNWYRRCRGSYPVVILFHHLISNRFHRMGIPTDIFLRQVEFLLKHYRVVSLSEGLQILHSGSCRVPTVILTFDDGYEDNFLYLRAVTEATGVPVSLFVCTKTVESRGEFQHDRESGGAGFRALGWDQIRYWQSDRIEFGSHTRSHYDCGSADTRALQGEIGGSREDMQRQLGMLPRFFAFPWGKACNMSPEALRIAASSYECSFSTLGFENFAKNGSVLQVAGRKPLPASVWELELTVQSIFDLPSRLWRGWAEP